MAQAWLRDATRADLAAYFRNRTAKADLDPNRVKQFEDDLTSPSRSANGEADRRKRAQTAASVIRDKSASEKPFEDPIYWGGFVYTGL
jgi:hypothetical protein